VWLTLIQVTGERGSVMPGTASMVTDVIWAAARAEDAVEHISTRLGCSSLTIGVFTHGQGDHRDGVTALALFDRARGMSPLLRGWSGTNVIWCGPPIAPPLPWTHAAGHGPGRENPEWKENS